MDGIHHSYTEILQCVTSSLKIDQYSLVWLIDWLDGGMICLAMFTMNVFHPGLLLEKADAGSPIAPTPAPTEADLKAAALHMSGESD